MLQCLPEAENFGAMPSHFEADETCNGKCAQNYQTKLIISSLSSQPVMAENLVKMSPNAQTRYGFHQFSKASKMSGIRWLMLATTWKDINRS